MTKKSRSTPTSRFSGRYADDGKAHRRAVREADGNRCVRCQHPFKSGKHGRGEWSPCDEKCTHRGPMRFRHCQTDPWDYSHQDPYDGFSPPAGECVSAVEIEAQWRILTVHHFDGDKGNDAWWNTMSLCQRCHLQIQGKVDPRVPYFFEHSDWIKPYVAGFYAKKYEGKDVTREEATARMSELLAYETKCK